MIRPPQNHLLTDANDRLLLLLGNANEMNLLLLLLLLLPLLSLLLPLVNYRLNKLMGEWVKPTEVTRRSSQAYSLCMRSQQQQCSSVIDYRERKSAILSQSIIIIAIIAQVYIARLLFKDWSHSLFSISLFFSVFSHSGANRCQSPMTCEHSTVKLSADCRSFQQRETFLFL